MESLIELDQLVAMRRSLQRAIPVNIFLSAATLSVAINAGRSADAAVWFAASMLVNALRFWLCRVPIRTCDGNGWSVSQQLSLQQLAAFASGSVWACVAILSDGFAVPAGVFYLTVLCGITAGAVTYGSSYWRAPAVFISPPILISFACLALAGTFDTVLLSSTMLVYYAALLIAAKESEAAFRNRSRLTHEAREMTRSLQAANEKSHATAQEMLHRATHDALTGLLNRAGFLQCLEAVVSSGKRDVCLMSMDLDEFKAVNDVYGHATGDRVLQKVARRLGEVTPPDTHIARLGGDEFALILADCASCAAMGDMAQRILDAVSAPFETFESSRVSSSIGFHVASGAGVGEMLAYADAALYAAKTAGRNRFELFDADMQRRVAMERDIELELPAALGGDDVEVWFQPIFNAQGGVDSVEALLRWGHPRHGAVDPALIVSVAARTGHSEQLFRFVVDRVFIMLHRLGNAGMEHVRVALNVSPREVARVPIDTILLELIAGHRVAADRLEVEITEETAIDVDVIRDRLVPLEQAGIRIVIDDFGVGYASLEAVRHIHISRLKIDRSYCIDIQRGSRAYGLLRAMIALGHSLDAQVVAEGVENEPCREILIELGCDLLQGYHLCRPMPASALFATACFGRSVA